MYKIIKLVIIILIFFFFYKVFSYYSSNVNVKSINSNRSNVEELLKTKQKDLPVLSNNTSNVIEFNSTFNEKIKDNKKRSFWDLLKDQ